MENCIKSDLILNVKKKDVRRFKAGAELSGKVNLMDVSVFEDETDTHEVLEVSLVLSNKQCGQPICVTAQ
jgi:hypothetical protein